MPAPSTLKHEFLKKWAMGLQLCCSLKKDTSMSISERKKAIKVSADVAMAMARNGRTHWSRALISNAYKDKDAKIMVDQMLGRSCDDDGGDDQSHGNNKKVVSLQIGSITHSKRAMSKKILKRSCCVGRPRKMKKAPPAAPLPASVAKRLVKKRTQVLKSLVPGTHAMDEFSLFEETLDYIVSLQAQVDVMRQVAHANGHN